MSSSYNTILIIEDDKEISSMLSEFFLQNAFIPCIAENGLTGLQMALSGSYHCVLLDLMLPYKSGDEVLKELRVSSDVPVIVLSAKSLTQNKIDLLGLGADDFMTKPFDLHELLARVQTNIKRYGNVLHLQNKGLLDFGPISMDTDAKAVTVNGQQVDLTAKEYAILELMLKNPEKVFTKQNLYESVWGEQYTYDNDTINTHISNLRKKLDSNVIKTIWGMGYRLKL
ncbi:MAG: response regulator transcription factor [Lachnospiraceae bacterium]